MFFPLIPSDVTPQIPSVSGPILLSLPVLAVLCSTPFLHLVSIVLTNIHWTRMHSLDARILHLSLWHFIFRALPNVVFFVSHLKLSALCFVASVLLFLWLVRFPIEWKLNENSIKEIITRLIAHFIPPQKPTIFPSSILMRSPSSSSHAFDMQLLWQKTTHKKRVKHSFELLNSAFILIII